MRYLGPVDAIAAMLADGGFTCVFTSFLPSALDAPEAVVCTDGGFECEVRTHGGERGTYTVNVAVVRTLPAIAGHEALAAEAWVRQSGWEPYAFAGAFRVLGLDTTVPAFVERDGSGRYVWAFTVGLTVERAL